MNIYFPSNKPQSNSATPTPEAPSLASIPIPQHFHPCSHSLPTCSPHYVCHGLHHQHIREHPQSCQNPPIDPNPSDNIVTRIDKIEEELVSIKTFIAKLESPVPVISTQPSQYKSTVILDEDDDKHDDPDPDHVSFASADEYIPSIDDFCFDQNQLNLNVPTNQLQ